VIGSLGLGWGGMALGWRWHGAGMALGWRWDGAGMALAWRWHGASMALGWGGLELAVGVRYIGHRPHKRLNLKFQA